jgi:hypothetical protein
MAVGRLIQIPGLTQQQYDQVTQAADPGSKAPQGLLYHAAGPLGDGWCIMEVWESQEAIDRFMAQTRDIMQGARVPAFQDQVFPIHKILQP